MQSHQLFVYGSLRSGFQHPAYAYISNNFTLVSQAKVKGKLYDLGDYPAAIATTDNCYIIGELYALKPEQDFTWVIAQLDDYEGLFPEVNELPLYKRELVTVYTTENNTTTAWVYWYNNEVVGKPLIISGDVLQYIQQKQQ